MADACLDIDLDAVERNIDRFHARAAAAGLAVRAHVKGHRLPRIAQMQHAAGATGIAVTSAAEARGYLAAGIADVVYAGVTADPWRWDGVVRLARHARLAVHIRDAAEVAALEQAACRIGVHIGVRIEVATRPGRPGAAPLAALGIARMLRSSALLRLEGVTGYLGPATAREAADLATATHRAATLQAVVELLRHGGHELATVTAGGTPTAQWAAAVPAVTELCAGAYALQDLGMVELGACRPEDVASTLDGERSEVERLLALGPHPWWERPRPPELIPHPRGVRAAPAHICAVVAQELPVRMVSRGRAAVRESTFIAKDRP